MNHYHEIGYTAFPVFTGVTVNMMPIVVGNIDTLPEYLKQYQSLINQTNLEHGSIAYLTVRESICNGHAPQSRGGIHVEAPANLSWGGSGWGGRTMDKGIYMASNDGACNIWDEQVNDRDKFGGCTPSTDSVQMVPNMLYWLTDRTPHEALASAAGTKRQFFRLVSDEVSVWFSQHNTPNPLGVMPSCPIVDFNKFEY